MPAFQANVFAYISGVRTEGATTNPSLAVQIAASQTIKAGDLLVKTSGANTYEQALALPGSNNSITASSGSLVIAGIAAEPITTNASGYETSTGKQYIEVALVGASTRWLSRFYNATASDSEWQDIAEGSAYRIGRWRGASASDWFYVVTTTTGNGEAIPVERFLANTPTDDYGAGWFKFASASVLL